MEHHHFQWGNSQYKGQFSMAMSVITRGYMSHVQWPLGNWIKNWDIPHWFTIPFAIASVAHWWPDFPCRFRCKATVFWRSYVWKVGHLEIWCSRLYNAHIILCKCCKYHRTKILGLLNKASFHRAASPLLRRRSCDFLAQQHGSHHDISGPN